MTDNSHKDPLSYWQSRAIQAEQELDRLTGQLSELLAERQSLQNDYLEASRLLHGGEPSCEVYPITMPLSQTCANRMAARACQMEPLGEKPCDCIELEDGYYQQRCDCRNSGDMTEAQQWCDAANKTRGC